MMILEFLAVIFAGLAGAGMMLLLTRVTRLPRWLVPVGAGAAMLAATVSSEYGWYNRTVASLPDGVTVAQAVPGSAMWRPWTYLKPVTERFVAVDTGRLRPNMETEQLYMTDLYFFARWQPVTRVDVMIDCAGSRRATPSRGDDSAPQWIDAGADDPIVKTVCEAV